MHGICCGFTQGVCEKTNEDFILRVWDIIDKITVDTFGEMIELSHFGFVLVTNFTHKVVQHIVNLFLHLESAIYFKGKIFDKAVWFEPIPQKLCRYYCIS